MNTPTPPNAVPESSLDSQATMAATPPSTRPMYWSVRRELWENRSIYIVPLIAGAVVMFGFWISLFSLPRRMRALAALDVEHQRAMLARPYGYAGMVLLLTAFLVGVFYCLEALHGERRDRSILFWKSLPVSDLTTVLSKAGIPLVVLPLLVLAIAVTLQLAMLLLSTVVLVLSGVGASTLWTQLPLFQMEMVLLYGLPVLALWHAPLYGWLLLVSGWARRTTFLWAVLPPLAICAVERLAFNKSYFAALLKYRLIGFAADAFAFRAQGRVPVDSQLIPLAQPDPGKFLSSPGLWIGLAVAAVLLAAAVRLRRSREPI